MKVAQDFNIYEISYFKLYLIAMSWLFAIWFPVLLSADLMVYVVAFVLLLIMAYIVMFKKEGNFYKTIFAKWGKARVFDNMGAFDMSVFKLAVVVSGLLIAKLFPIVLTAHLAWYVGVAASFIGYHIHGLVTQK